jgi:hypothetical protein
MKHNVQEDFAERVCINQQQPLRELRTRFDYIVCGAGTSGSGCDIKEWRVVPGCRDAGPD